MQFDVTFRLLAGIRRDKEAEKALIGAAQLFLIAHYRRGKLESVLKTQGFEATSGAITNPPRGDEEFIEIREYEDKREIDVPIRLQRDGAGSSANA